MEEAKRPAAQPLFQLAKLRPSSAATALVPSGRRPSALLNSRSFVSQLQYKDRSLSDKMNDEDLPAGPPTPPAALSASCSTDYWAEQHNSRETSLVKRFDNCSSHFTVQIKSLTAY